MSTARDESDNVVSERKRMKSVNYKADTIKGREMRGLKGVYEAGACAAIGEEDAGGGGGSVTVF
jgi:hypothetical protein